MTDITPLEGKKVLIVDDEPDVLETLEDILFMCQLTRAEDFESARSLMDEEHFDFAILDIMGVDGYALLRHARKRQITTVMLTAHAVSPDHVIKSFRGGAAFYVPKEEMVNITTYLVDILAAKAEGKSTWGRWFHRMASFCERKFGSDWQKGDKLFWEKFPFY